jgi:hypothetical protein
MTVILLATIFFCTSAVSVVTGGTSLLTVPVMIQFGMEHRKTPRIRITAPDLKTAYHACRTISPPPRQTGRTDLPHPAFVIGPRRKVSQSRTSPNL